MKELTYEPTASTPDPRPLKTTRELRRLIITSSAERNRRRMEWGEGGASVDNRRLSIRVHEGGLGLDSSSRNVFSDFIQVIFEKR